MLPTTPVDCERRTSHKLAGAFAARTWNLRAHLVAGRILLGDQMLALPGLAVDDRDAVRAVHAIVGAGQQIAVPLGEVIGHAADRADQPPLTSASPLTSARLPEGATPSGRSAGRSVVVFGASSS